MTTERPDPNRPLFANLDDEETSSTGTPSAPAAPPVEPFATAGGAGSGAIPLGAPATPGAAQPDEADESATDDGDPRGH